MATHNLHIIDVHAVASFVSVAELESNPDTRKRLRQSPPASAGRFFQTSSPAEHSPNCKFPRQHAGHYFGQQTLNDIGGTTRLCTMLENMNGKNERSTNRISTSAWTIIQTLKAFEHPNPHQKKSNTQIIKIRQPCIH